MRCNLTDIVYLQSLGLYPWVACRCFRWHVSVKGGLDFTVFCISLTHMYWCSVDQLSSDHKHSSEFVKLLLWTCPCKANWLPRLHQCPLTHQLFIQDQHMFLEKASWIQDLGFMCFRKIVHGVQNIGPNHTEKGWGIIAHCGKQFPTVANHFPRWASISDGGKPFPTVGNCWPSWVFLLA